jgi:hypothetical protein
MSICFGLCAAVTYVVMGFFKYRGSRIVVRSEREFSDVKLIMDVPISSRVLSKTSKTLQRCDATPSLFHVREEGRPCLLFTQNQFMGGRCQQQTAKLDVMVWTKSISDSNYFFETRDVSIYSALTQSC